MFFQRDGGRGGRSARRPLIAYGRARVGFLIGHREIARAALDGSQPVPAGSQTPISQMHIRMRGASGRDPQKPDVLFACP
jgi:hypothetical protein